MKKLFLLMIICSILLISCKDGVGVATTEDVLTEYGTPNSDYVDTSLSYENGSGVMLQAFSWESHKQNGNWWNTISNNADAIKNRFEYVWFPPCTNCHEKTGYLPRELNDFNSDFGSESQLKAAIDNIQPAKPIADAVVNHRVGSNSWGDFVNPDWGTVKGENYKAICSTDEGFSSEPKYMGKVPSSMRGASDTGDNYGSARDLDHTNAVVQDGIIEWMKKLQEMGFVGYRYDYVRGFAGKYVGYYNEKTDAEFSVGELWPENYTPSGWNKKINNWINSTTGEVNSVKGRKSSAFDFVLKGILNDVFGNYRSTVNKNFGSLADSNILARNNPEYAVTFVDNHDTGSTQRHWPIDELDIGCAYVYILTHPGVPCVAWQHYFASGTSDSIGNNKVYGTTQTLQQHINYLIALRNTIGITKTSKVSVLDKDNYIYAAKITGKTEDDYLIVAIGNGSYSAPKECVPIYSGSNFIIYTKSMDSVTE